MSLEQEEPPSEMYSQSVRGRKWGVNAGLCRANCLESILKMPGPECPQTSDGRPGLTTTRSPNRAHKLQKVKEPNSQWLIGASPSLLAFSWKEWK